MLKAFAGCRCNPVKFNLSCKPLPLCYNRSWVVADIQRLNCLFPYLVWIWSLASIASEMAPQALRDRRVVQQFSKSGTTVQWPRSRSRCPSGSSAGVLRVQFCAVQWVLLKIFMPPTSKSSVTRMIDQTFLIFFKLARLAYQRSRYIGLHKVVPLFPLSCFASLLLALILISYREPWSPIKAPSQTLALLNSQVGPLRLSFGTTL